MSTLRYMDKGLFSNFKSKIMSKSKSDSALNLKSIPHALDFTNSVKRTYFYTLTNYLVTGKTSLRETLEQIGAYQFAYFVYAEIVCKLVELSVDSDLINSLLKTVSIMGLAHWYSGASFNFNFVQNLLVICLAIIVYQYTIRIELEKLDVSVAVKDIIQSLLIYIMVELAGDRQFNIEWLLNTGSKLVGIWLYYHTSNIEY